MSEVPPAPEAPEVPAPPAVEAPKDPIAIAAEAAGARNAPAEVAPVGEETAVIETATGDHPSGEVEVGEVATVPPSRRAQAQARRQAAIRSKAEKAANRAATRSGKDRPAPAEALVARFPGIHPAWAAVITGVLCGLVSVLLVKGGTSACNAIYGTDSCGGGVGLLAIVAVLAIEVLVGASLLKAWKVADPFSTSFLGVGLVAMVVMLFFLNAIDNKSMVVVVPVITGVSFLLSWWVTVKFVEETPTSTTSDQSGSTTPDQPESTDVESKDEPEVDQVAEEQSEVEDAEKS